MSSVLLALQRSSTLHALQESLTLQVVQVSPVLPALQRSPTLQSPGVSYFAGSSRLLLSLSINRVTLVLKSGRKEEHVVVEPSPQ